MNSLDPQRHEPDDILAVYLVVNGAWGMSAGKLAAQAFQACQRLLTEAAHGSCTAGQRHDLDEWARHGTRTITKFAPTTELFERCRAELPGVTMVDEGLTEGTDGPTMHATWPVRRGDRHRMLAHKRVRLQPPPSRFLVC